MQETADSIVKFVGIWMAALSTILVLLAPLVGLIVSACVAAGWLKADSGIAVFVAKLFPMSLHAQSGKPKRPPVGPAAVLMFAIGAAATQVGCAAAIPKVSTPCDGLYCLEWSGNEVGLPASALICAKTDFELQSTVRKLSEQHPRSTFRRVGAQ